MARQSTSYVCGSCGHRELRWSGRCGGCGEWNTLTEVAGEAPRRRGRAGSVGSGAPKAVPLREVSATAADRLSTGVAELDRVLGGGVVPGSLVLLGGAPGIG